MNTIIIVGMSISFCIIICFSIGILLNSRYKKRQSYITGFESYIVVLDYHLQKAFDIVYKDRILIYSLEATKPDDKEFAVITRIFLQLVLKMLGPTLIKEYHFLYGDEDTFLFILTEYFNTRYEEDTIRESSVNTLMGEEDNLPAI